jgi:hypothetical protein
MQRTISSGVAPGRRAAIVGALMFVLRAGTLAQTYPSVDELVNKHTAALGGGEKIRAIQAIKAIGRLINRGGVEFPLTICLKRPGLMRIDLNVHGKSIIRAFDGSETWAINPLTGSEEPKKGDESELQRARETVDEMFTGDLFDYKAKGSKLEFAGNEEAHGRPAYKLKLVNRYGTVKYIYLDAETFLEIKTMTVRSHAGPEKGPEEYSSDYRPVAGVMIAYSSELQKDGETMKIVFDKVEANLAMEETQFKFPMVSAAGALENALAKIPPGALRVRVTQHGYDPAKLEFPANQPVTLAFTRESPSACGAEVVFPSLSIRKVLPLGETVLVSLPPQSSGEIRFSCGMGMLRGMIVAR